MAAGSLVGKDGFPTIAHTLRHKSRSSLESARFRSFLSGNRCRYAVRMASQISFSLNISFPPFFLYIQDVALNHMGALFDFDLPALLAE